MNRSHFKFIFLCLLITANTPSLSKQPNNKNIHFIGTWHGGFFTSFNCVLNHLNWCQKNDKTPIVYWDQRSLYSVAKGFNNSTNVWEYYFEPVSSLNLIPSNPIKLEFFPGDKKQQNINYRLFEELNIDQETRDKASALISTFIKIKPNILKKINNFYNQYMASKQTIGIHLRGTDKKQETKLIKPETIIAIALQYADPETQFLIASDEQILLDSMIDLLGNRTIIYYDCYRSENGKPLHTKKKKPSRAQIGEDVLVEAALLSRCDMFIHATSNVATGALYFNPDMPHVLVK